MPRVCNCVGYMTNPGGVCCRDLPPVGGDYIGRALPAMPLTEERLRQIIREELDRTKR